MNFLLHREFAERRLGSSAAAHGAMLPDLWRIADRRVRPRPGYERTPAPDGRLDVEIEAGIAHHLEVDRWFHASDAFLAGERRTAERFQRAELVAPRMGMLAHVTWELSLDGALVRRLGAPRLASALAASFEQAAAAAERAARRHHFDRIARTPGEWAAFTSRMRTIETRLVEGPWIESYASGEGIARVLGYVRSRLALSPLGERDLARVAEAAEALLIEADAALDAVLHGP